VGFFPDQEQKIPGNPEILEVILARKSLTRESREGWPLLTVETDVNGDIRKSIRKLDS
jgi:hypothetical protein